VDKQVPNAQYKHYLGFDLSVLSRCDIMVLLPGWKNSIGCREEVRFCLMQGIPVYDLQNNTMTVFIPRPLCEICNSNIKQTTFDLLITDYSTRSKTGAFMLIVTAVFCIAVFFYGLYSLAINFL